MPEKGIEQIPVAGPITTFVASRFWVPSGTRRVEEWLKEFADDFDRHCQGCTVENLVQDGAFISASIQIVRIVIATHQEEKREYLRNALLNIVVGKTTEIKHQIFLAAIEAFVPAHVKVLNMIHKGIHPGWDQHRTPMGHMTYATAIGLLVPELHGEPALINAVLTDLRNRGLATLSNANSLFPQGGLVTNLSAEFLNFVLTPVE